MSKKPAYFREMSGLLFKELLRRGADEIRQLHRKAFYHAPWMGWAPMACALADRFADLDGMVQEAADAIAWRDQAAALKRVLDRQNADLYKTARERDLLLHQVRQWAAWRRGQCDLDQASPEELALLEKAR